MARRVLNGLDLSAQRIINLADPSGATDAVTKQYVDNAVNGLSWKPPVRVAATTNGALATAYANGQTVDGVVIATGDRLLLPSQTTGTENGIYTANASGAPTRTADADSTAELQSATVYVIQGTVNGDKAFTQTANSPVVGTTPLVWAQVGGGTSYSAGNGLTLASTTFSVNADGTSVIADGTSTRVNPAYTKLANKFAANIGDGSTTAITVTHNLGTKDRLGQPLVFLVSTGELVEPDIIIGTNSDTVTFAVAPASGAYRYTTAG